MILPFKIAVAAVLLFGTGVMTGVTLARFGPRAENSLAEVPVIASVRSGPIRPATIVPMDRPGRTNAMRGLGLKPVGAGRFEHLKRLLDELELSAEQRARVEGHFRESQDRLKKLLKPLQPEASRELRELRLRLAIELNPEQRLQFERLLSERLDRGRSRP